MQPDRSASSAHQWAAHVIQVKQKMLEPQGGVDSCLNGLLLNLDWWLLRAGHCASTRDTCSRQGAEGGHSLQFGRSQRPATCLLRQSRRRYLAEVEASIARYHSAEIWALQRYPISESLSAVVLRGSVHADQVAGGVAASRMWVWRQQPIGTPCQKWLNSTRAH